MGYLALLPVFQLLIERLFPDKEKAAAAQLALQQALSQAESERMKAQSEVIKAEISSSSWAAMNWRPWLMMCCVAIICNNWILIPLLTAFHLPVVATPIPAELWTLVTIGLGGYIGKETISNYSANKYQFNDQKFFNKVREMFPNGMSQEQVNILNEAKKEAQE